MTKTLYCLAAIVVVTIFSTTMAVGITGDEIRDSMIAAYEEQMENIDDIIIISDKETRYQKKAEVDGRTVYKTRIERDLGSGINYITVFDGVYNWTLNPVTGEVDRERSEYDSSEIITALKDADLEYVGEEELNGYTTYMLDVKEMDMILGPEMEHDISSKIWVDSDNWVIRKMEATVDDEFADERLSGPVTVHMKDYRDVEGLLVPFLTEFTIGGEGVEMTPEERQQMKESLRHMEKELEDMPAMQRRMVEGTMKSQMENMEKLLESENGMSISVLVEDVEVNTGLPDHLFDGESLGQ